MAFNLSTLVAIAGAYLLILFFVAWSSERGWIPQRWIRHPAVYVLSLGVYASAWGIYGSVGHAQQYGYNFLPYFIGVSGLFLLAPIVLMPILRLTSSYQLSSLADLFAFRYRSRWAGALTTLILLFGMLPLMALQLKAVSGAMETLTGEPDSAVAALAFAVIVAVFAIFFGARHATLREKHEGLVAAIAFESLIKLVTFSAVALFALFGVFGGPGGLVEWLNTHPEELERLYQPLQSGQWHGMMMAFFLAAVVMPHMFYMTFTENMSPRGLLTASWALPLYLFALALAVPLILWGGLALGLDGNANYFSLQIGLETRQHVAVWGYLAGLAGASGMLIVATLALSGMCLNHLILPSISLQSYDNLYRNLRWIRRGLIIAIVVLIWLAFRFIATPYSLNHLGVVSLLVCLQFAPGLMGTLFWPTGNVRGFLAGILAGLVATVHFSLLPSLYATVGALDRLPLAALYQQRPALDWQDMALVSLLINSIVYVLFSIVTRTSPAERTAGETCAIGSLKRSQRWELKSLSVGDFIQMLSIPLGMSTARREVLLALADLRLDESESRPYALRRLRDQLESNLSGLLGPSVAHQIIDQQLPYVAHAEHAERDDIHFIEARLEQYQNRLSGLAAELDSLRRFHRQTLLELPLGVVSLGSDGEIMGWNRAMESLTGIAATDTLGAHLSALPEPWGEQLNRCSHADDSHLPNQKMTHQGTVRWLNVHRSSLQGHPRHAGPSGQIMMVEDVTDRRTMENRLAHHQRLASIGRLAAGVAHEIGNPVTAIACLSQNLQHEDSFDEQQRTANEILEQTRRITRIVESLVSFSHAGQGAPNQMEMITAPVSVLDTVNEAIRLLSMDVDYHQHRFINQCDSSHYVIADSQRLLQVFINLLGNAADASEPDEPIRVHTQQASDNDVKIIVEDHGHGIPEGMQNALFEPFVTSKSPGRGTGLGLALVYSIVQDHRGQIEVISPISHQQGTRFIITLPAATAEAKDSRP